MKKSLTVLWIWIFAVSACAPATPSSEIPATDSLITPYSSPTSVPPANVLPTFSFSSTPIGPEASPTVPVLDTTPLSESQSAGCSVVALREGIALNPGPFISMYRLLPVLELNVRYEVVDLFPTFYQLARDGVPVGWVEYMTMGLSTEGADCAQYFDTPDVPRELTDFSGLCFFTVDRPTETFRDSALTEGDSMGLSAASGPMVALWKSRKSIFTSVSHAGPSFYVPAEEVSLFGDCEGLPTSATVNTVGWLWSQPDESQGEQLLQLTVGMSLHIEGQRPPDASSEAAWVQAVAEIQGERISGWVWSALLTFE